MKFDKLIVNSSPIIALANIGYADLLLHLTKHLLIPRGVYEEISYHKYSDSASGWIKNLDSSLIYEVETLNPIAEWNLGKGESQVLSFSYNNGCLPVVIDDKAARNCAEVFKIKTLGTISVIVLAKKLSLISDMKPLFYALRANGFRISDDILETALKLSDE